jgi:hypothetical protein
MKSFNIFPEKNLIVYRPVGIISATDIIDYIQNVVKDHKFKEGLIEYIDLSQVEDWKLAHQEVEKVTYVDSNGMGTVKKINKCAIFAPSDIAFGMARMYQNFADKYNSNIYISREMEDALAYLELKKEDVIT